MKNWIYAGALLLGVVIGTSLVHTTDGAAIQRTASDDSVTAVNGKAARAPEPVGVRIGRLISAETTAMNEDMPLNKATDVLFAERKSPMRTRAFLKNRIQMMTTDQLYQALMNAEVQTKAELEEAARRLATEDPEGVFNHFVSDEFRLSGMDNVYTFMDRMLQTWADVDAPAVMAGLQKMTRGGSQQDMSLRFSGYWAKIDPEAAARHFNDLVYLRNMQDQGAMVFTDNPFAEQIVKSWKQKDEAAMREYIGKLPGGREREALEKAAEKLDTSKR
jgi:hypothetical protein